MKIIPRIEVLKAKKLLGQSIKMSLAQNKTGQLWGQFAPNIKTIANTTSTDKISMQIYPSDYFKEFHPNKEFEKWAAVAVQDFNDIPKGMRPFLLESGLYAIFDYKGPSNDSSVFQYIFMEWIPNSNYVLDDRPHFEILGAKYKNNDPDSEEEIYIPVKEK